MCEAYIRLHIWIEIYHPLLHCFNYPLTWYKASSDCWAKPTGIFALLLQKRKKEKKRRTKEDNFSIVLLYREYQIISLKSCLISHLCSHLVGFYLSSHLAQFSSYFCAWFFAVPRGERTDKKDSNLFWVIWQVQNWMSLVIFFGPICPSFSESLETCVWLSKQSCWCPLV